MNTIYFNSKASDDVCRERLYNGQLLVYSANNASRALCNLASQMIREAFNALDPKVAQYHMTVEQYVNTVAPLKPKFIHHPESLKHIRDIVIEVGCDPEETYIDVPRLRMVTHGGYLTSGVGYAHHPHRDTWYSAPMAQINWWLPIFELESECSMAFHPRYWSEPVLNDSEAFNYYQWNSVGRANAASQIKSDTRKQPKPQEPVELEPQLRVVTEPAGLLLFSAAQLHSTVPNTSGYTRYSIDFRTVNVRDVLEDRGAPNIDSKPLGTSLRDFVRASDFSRMPEEIAAKFDEGVEREGVLVYKPAAGGAA